MKHNSHTKPIAVVLGIGLIGGSLALCLQQRTQLQVYGYDVNEESLAIAQELQVITKGFTDLESAVAEADFIFLAVPVEASKRLLSQLSNLQLKEGCIISDVGSTKDEVVRHAAELPGITTTFIGGHPMAGSHQTGVRASHSLLFENAYYVLTPLPHTPLAQVAALSRILEQATRAKLVIMAPDHHDRVVGAISHLPHVIASGLVNLVERYNEENEWFHHLAAGGFRDLTRVAAADPVMWRDILLSNQQALLPLMEDWILEMKEIYTAIAEANQTGIEDFFTRARRSRQGLPERKRGALPSFYECYVDVPDRLGMIAEVAAVLAEEKINIQNVGVMENREERAGVMRLVFAEEGELMQAHDVLQARGYRVYDEEEEKGKR
ncbi:prephenate dehydrogenase [Mechercharimyces sp. CAU 1602]|uniref:prephenate dehydrogenase n=1 Tax=Mechercharimyces sp. CAU 1602 TaxID=2973933 RepID=UPI0021615C65|nr:prephenate dehydrogenase [Mechercharimyces sp. CAU 1602]MCS1350592.1 prephenate dehydrogenase [Mechercharimyces sp. CAU 1602]